MLTKEFFFIVGLAVLASAFLVQRTTKPLVNISDEKIEVVFAKGMKQAELDAIQRQLAEKSITLTYKDLKFNHDRLSGINFEVEDSKGTQGSAKTFFPFFSIFRFGFVLEYEEGGGHSIRVGKI